jgi:hypothetical protein
MNVFTIDFNPIGTPSTVYFGGYATGNNNTNYVWADISTNGYWSYYLKNIYIGTSSLIAPASLGFIIDSGASYNIMPTADL